ncbi:sensor histidine kinase [Treponema brennaborense]|uniref:histidine kinase n=1 Tax=Treponema brennaborense (strain DSM 12168 / CIP 105900 / DD5/3) TaxID=906968 RepID=F4LIR3_TREBD|nr:HAMP domain-containing sensor histidine kinase [Treponema brennaborense]AEE16238.1 integral membrane sensor signal transduction histidine kinase [Treponema brennaborense DSM 12168]
MKTIFGKIFSGQIAVSCAVLLIMSFIFSAAIRTSVSSWNFDKQDELKKLLLPVISKTYRLTGGLSESSLEKALLPYVTDSLYVYVFDTDRKPLLLLEQGKRKTVPEVEKSTGPLTSFLSLNPPVPIKDGTTLIGYLAADSVDFLAYKANRIFLSTMERALAVGALAAVACALVLSILTSSVFSAKTAVLSNSITGLPVTEAHIASTGIQEFDRITESVRQLQTTLKREESLRRQWMQDISHDLRTPLTAVKMQIEGLSDGVLHPDAERFAALYSELNHIERLVCNLQDLSRFESPEMEIHPAAVDPYAFTADIKERFSLLAERNGVTLQCDVRWQKHGESVFYADVLLLQRCVSNIVQNAFQHTAAGGIVTFLIEEKNAPASRRRTAAAITVTNPGRIDEADIPRVFDRLYRADRSRSSEGSGLGLSIAKAIVQLHDGSISISNEPPDAGGARPSTVRVYIELPVRSHSGSKANGTS